MPCSILMPDGRACQRHDGDHHDHEALITGNIPLDAYPGTPTSNGGGTTQFTPVICFLCPEDGEMEPYFLWSLPGLVSRIASSAMNPQSNSQSQVVHVQNSHTDIYRISLRCLIPPKSDPKKVCGWYWQTGSSQQPITYVNTLPWFTHVASNLHNDQVVQCAICKIFSNAGENRAHVHMHYVLHPCQCPGCTVTIIHTPAYRDHWALSHARQYSLAEIDLDTSKQPIALKIRDKFRPSLRLPEGNEPEDFHKAAYTSWNAPVRSRTPMEELRLQTSMDPTYPARLMRSDVNPYYDATSDIVRV